MYAYLFFGLAILGIFSIFENLKGRQKLTFFKLNILGLLFIITLNSILDFTGGSGTFYGFIYQFSRMLGTILTINLFYLIASNKIPKIVVWIEWFIIIVYTIQIVYGFRFPIYKEGRILTGITFFNVINILLSIFLIVGSMGYNLYLINKIKQPLNLYQEKIKRWSYLLFISVFIILILIGSGIFAYFKPTNSVFIDSRIGYISIRYLMIAFILFRPKFIDEAGLSPISLNFVSANQVISLQKFDFLFYSNYYFLQQEASIEDFALKLNHHKSEIIAFLKSQNLESFNELLNKSRTNYFKELLRSGKHMSFTIEALSEMSGFNNRQTMYNSFKKYEGCSPTEFINHL